MKKLKTSLVVTILNEICTITKLLDSIQKQTYLPDEIIIIDAKSTDGTIDEIKKHRLKTKLLIRKGISRSKGRNLGIRLARNEVIAMTDAGCILKKDWLAKVTQPILNKKTEVVAGFYNMVGNSSLQKVMAVYLGTLPSQFNRNFLPSTRSIAFTKRIWEMVGGFPERLKGTAEDTAFNQKLISHDVKITRVKNARVEWGMPKTIGEFFKKLFNYAKGDVQSKIIWNKAKGLSSHNIKAFFVTCRTVVLVVIVLISLFVTNLIPHALMLVFLYLIFSIAKIYKKLQEWRVVWFAPVVQLVADVAVSLGFLRGILLLWGI